MDHVPEMNARAIASGTWTVLVLRKAIDRHSAARTFRRPSRVDGAVIGGAQQSYGLIDALRFPNIRPPRDGEEKRVRVKFRRRRRLGQGASYSFRRNGEPLPAKSAVESSFTSPWWDAAIILGPLVLTKLRRLISFFRSIAIHGVKFPCCHRSNFPATLQCLRHVSTFALSPRRRLFELDDGLTTSSFSPHLSLAPYRSAMTRDLGPCTACI
ncbi:hypothetical protein J3R83DRAFT_6701 [Lanmaoa asiatica]|nr:hypothetical protein J3R83DRAFT_6701 [Lanmaoa asiatica]